MKKNVIQEAIALHSELLLVDADINLSNENRMIDNLHALISELHQSTLSGNNHSKSGSLYRSLQYLDHIEFELRGNDMPEGWKNLEFIMQEINGLKKTIYTLILSLNI